MAWWLLPRFRSSWWAGSDDPHSLDIRNLHSPDGSRSCWDGGVVVVRGLSFQPPEDYDARQQALIREGSERLFQAIQIAYPQRCPVQIVDSLPRPNRIRVSYSMNGPAVGREVLRIVAEGLNLPVSEITGACRELLHVDARALVIGTLRKRGWSFPQIGRLLDRDHSSVISAYGKLEIYLKRNADAREIWEALAPFRSRKV